MAAGLKRIDLRPDTDLLHLLEEVHADRTPRLIEREGVALAVVVNPEDYAEAMALTKDGTARALKAAGAWSDLDTDAMLKRTYDARHEAPTDVSLPGG
ncbi:MAG: hypothetical protein HYX92_06255 [Chloroflexi bacterium]|nr:hypothetical protein [Chloroflexota bacterium]